LQLRINLLEYFLDLPPPPPPGPLPGAQKPSDSLPPPEPWSASPEYLIGAPGELVIVDLTDPVVDVDAACVLFDTCLSLFLAQTACGKIITLDEAHNYLLKGNAAAEQFTDKLLKSIREQRHIGTRIVIATQEPTLDTSLLDLCSITMVHRCSSPAWFEDLKKHVVGIYLNQTGKSDGEVDMGVNSRDRELMSKIVGLQLGESFLFCPTAVIGIGKAGEVTKMVERFVKFRTRKRITADGGRTKVADSEGALE
jgi:hypothetical protein